MHNYTVLRWPPAFTSTGFGETEYVQVLKSKLDMEELWETRTVYESTPARCTTFLKNTALQTASKSIPARTQIRWPIVSRIM
jgi:hypothetical protein